MFQIRYDPPYTRVREQKDTYSLLLIIQGRPMRSQLQKKRKGLNFITAHLKT